MTDAADNGDGRDLKPVPFRGRVADVHRKIPLVSEPAPVAHGARLTAVGADSETP
jgi:hypothetical protein